MKRQGHIEESFGGKTKPMTEIGPCDVLLGRGTGPNENQGNKFYRDVLRKYKEEYRIASNRREKKIVVMKAIEEVKKKGGRFLEKVKSSGERKGNEKFEEVKDPVAFLKTRQAFRYILQGATTGKKQDPSEEGDEDNTSANLSESKPPTRNPLHHATIGLAAGQGLSTGEKSLQAELADKQILPELSPNPFLQRLVLSVDSPLVSNLQVSPFLHSSVGQRRGSSLLSLPDQLFSTGSVPGTPLQNMLLQHHDPTGLLGHTALGRTSLGLRDPRTLSSTNRAGLSPFGTGRLPLSEGREFERRLNLLDPLVRASLRDDVLLRPMDDLILDCFRNSSPISTQQTFSGQSPSMLSRAALTEQFMFRRAVQQQRQQQAARLQVSNLLAPNLKALGATRQQPPAKISERMKKEKDVLSGKERVDKAKNLHQIMSSLPGDKNCFRTGQNERG